jgi:DNA-binding XRE family transcriptional regulator
MRRTARGRFSTARARQDSGLPALGGRPTDAMPGTPEKVEVLAARAAGRVPLHQAGDSYYHEGVLLNWERSYNKVMRRGCVAEENSEVAGSKLTGPAPVAVKVERLRLAAGLSVRALARRVGRPHSSILALEEGRRPLSFTLLVPLADFFGVTLDWLLESAS